MARGTHIIVVGAGAFGGWTALSLLRAGAGVTLIDAWGAGHSRSSSGDETRLIRTMYDGDRVYIDLVVRSFALWRDAEASWGRKVFCRTGALYIFAGDDGFATRSLPLMRERGVAVEQFTPAQASTRFPQMAFDNVRVVYFEPGAGVLLARLSCELVKETFEHEGGVYHQAHVSPARLRSGRLTHVTLDGRRTLEADAFVFACGPWLGQVLPDVVGDGIVATRQEVFYFGTPAGDARFDAASLPAWIDFGRRSRYYGMPGNERRGVKVASDDAGPAIDPTTANRVVSAGGALGARRFVRRRFPELAKQPIVETRVCQYEFSPNGDFLIDRHPAASNVWVVGGGSGHGFKMGPALGEYASRLVIGGASADSQFSYAHFAAGRERLKRTARRKTHP